MTYISEIGFLGTKAFFYTDIVLIYMIMLPFLMIFSIGFAMKHYYVLHKMTQVLLFFITLGMLSLFYYEIFLSNIFDNLFIVGNTESNQSFYFLMLHVIIALITFILWKSTILFASADKKRRALPGLYSRTHKIVGKRVLLGVVLIALTVGVLYRMLYVA